MTVALRFLLVLTCALFIGIKPVKAQCPELFDGLGNPTPNPVWVACFGGNFTLNVQSPDNIGSWTIDWGDGSPISSGASLIPPAFVSHTYGATIDTFNLVFTETSSGCVINGLVVMEEPSNASIQIPFGGVTQACAPATLEFVNSSTDVSPTTVFTWDFGDGTPPVVFNNTNAGQTVQHQYLPGTVNCNTVVTLEAENFCNTLQGGPSTATFNPIQIWDIDDAAIQASDILLCYPDTIVTFENITDRNCFAQGNTFQRQELWNFGDYWGQGQDSIIGWQPWPPTFPQTIAYPGIGTYDVTLFDSSFCGIDVATITIQIVPPPFAGLTLSDDTICAGDMVTGINGSGGGANSFDWNFGDGSGWQTMGPGNQTHSYIAPGDYIISLVANIAGGTASCTDTITMPIHVLPSPTAQIITSGNAGCDSLDVTFTDASINAVMWNWDFGNGNTSTLQNPPQQTYNTAGSYNVSLMVESINGCQDQANATIDVFISPVVAFIPNSVCENELAQFMDQSTSSPGDPIISWDWDFDDGNTSTLEDPTNTYTATGVYNISLTVSTATCSATDIVPITVESVPTAGFTQDLNNGCTPLLVNMTNTSTGAVNYQWYFGDGDSSTLVDPSHAFINPETYDTTYNTMLIASTAFGCVDTAILPVTVFSGAVADFTHNGLPGCAPLNVDFVNMSTGAINYQWDFGDGNTSTVQDPSHAYINTTLFIQNYTVQLIATSANGCVDTMEQIITVYPIADFGFTSVPDSGCSPLSVTFPSVIGAVDYQWDFGDGNTGIGPTPTHVYVNTTTNSVQYTVELIATSPFGCVDTNYGQVTVFPNPTAQIQLVANTGCHPFDVEIQNLSTGAVSYEWDYGDGNQSTNPNASHNYVYSNTSGTTASYNLSLVATSADGCTDTATTVIDVFPEVTAAFDSDTIGCSPLLIAFNNLSQNGATYEWDFGDGNVDFTQFPNHTFINNTANIIVYTVQLIAISPDGCRDTVSHPITVYPEPIAAFNANPTLQTFPATTVNVINNTAAGPWSYEWNFGDGTISTLQSPGSNTYATWGQYVIQLVVSTPYCSDTAEQIIDIEPPVPAPGFIGSGEGCSPLTVEFTDTSLHADTYFWDFGDGNSSTQQNPIYTYYGAGTYSVTLTVTGPGGTASVTHVDSVVVQERANAYFTFGPQVVYVPSQPVQFYNLSSFASSYIWDFGDGSIDSLNSNPFHYYQDVGTYTVTLIATNEWGCADTFAITNAVEANEGGTIDFPNAFTPDENGPNGGYYNPNALDNDIFFPVFEGVDEYHLQIFNRWGELIFETFDPNQGWDGYYRDQICKQDVYVWKARVKFSDGRTKIYSGDLTLLR